MTNKATSPGAQAPLRSTTALLILDMLSDFRFPQGRSVFSRAIPIARRVAALRRRAHSAHVPVIYVNDNYGPWRSDLQAMLQHCSETHEGTRILQLLAPAHQDLIVLKPKHSGFYATALDTLLEYIGARTLVITGISSNQCVLFTANDAYVRDYTLCIPQDCIAAPSRSETTFALRYFQDVLSASTAASTRIRFRKGRTQSRRGVKGRM